MTNPMELFHTPAFPLKLLELVLCCVCVALFASSTVSFSMTIARWIVVVGAFVGFLMICVIEILGAIIGSPLHKTLRLVVSLPAAALFVTAGGMLLEKASDGTFIVAGILGIINGVVYLVDFILLASGRM
ncbi:uncharacterized protein [Periplaneta americana]|uniref:uncharacterized protein isoform X3 n=1 Tax=Periplaneta americana TaxID=6978 RepID=UPI0037E80E50